MTTNQAPRPASPATAHAAPVPVPVNRLGVLARETGLVLAGTAAIALIGQVAVPLPFTPVPITLGTLAALGVGAVLGSRRGVVSALLLAVLAAVGAPVLAGWTSGMTATFGYVLGYALVAAVAGRAAADWRGDRPTAVRALRSVALMLVASALIYVPGLLWLKAATAAPWATVLAMGLAPFVVGDVLKSLVAAGIAPLRGALHR